MALEIAASISLATIFAAVIKQSLQQLREEVAAHRRHFYMGN